ncbi:MAG: GreA/GreB family elongation factor [Candidatus Shapirobacteria bacterium]|jgi:transcription elongation factor GreA
MNKTLLTQEGYQQLTKKLDDLKDKQSRLITQLEEVAQPDESGEDGLATQLKEELEVVNDQIDQITESLENSEIISGKTIQSTIVQVGSTVKIKIANTNTKTYNIVTHLEADPSQNKISDQSPLGQALLGKKMLDEIEIEAPVGKITYKIVSIS